MPRQKRIGTSSSLCVLPLIREMRDDEAFDILVDTPTKNSIKLREHILDGSFLSPIDYARGSSIYRIVPGIAVSSRQAIDLHFRESIRTINTLAVDPSSSSEIVLAKILLAEEFDVEPQIVPVMGPLAAMLSKADSALLVGDAVLLESPSHVNRLDLLELWCETTELPYVHGFWCGRENDLSVQEIRRIQSSQQSGVAALSTVAFEASRGQGMNLSPQEIKEYLDLFSYDFTDEVSDAVREFLSFAHYHGILPDIADLNFYSSEPSKPGAVAHPSFN
jgi:chorismate dehydratase